MCPSQTIIRPPRLMQFNTLFGKSCFGNGKCSRYGANGRIGCDHAVRSSMSSHINYRCCPIIRNDEFIACLAHSMLGEIRCQACICGANYTQNTERAVRNERLRCAIFLCDQQHGIIDRYALRGRERDQRMIICFGQRLS